MEWFHEAKAQAENQGWLFTLTGPILAGTLRQCERRLPFRLSADLRRFLAAHGSGALFHKEEADSSGLHLLDPGHSAYGINGETAELKRVWERQAQGLVVFAQTPGAGAFYLAITKDGQIVDLWGLPNRERQDPEFPAFRGEWRIIAPSFEALLQRMFREKEPLFWL